MTQTPEPKLAPPGAGIPFPAKLVLRFVVKPLVAGRSKPDQNLETLEKIQNKILREIEGLTDEQLTKRILVPPQRGLEDSSRFWSIAMTLEHLVIVGSQIEAVVVLLSQGNTPSKVADTAKVKPLGVMPAKESVEAFQKFANEVLIRLPRNTKDIHSKMTFRHPWFGKMNALQWQWLLGMHTGLHLQQIRAIKNGLKT